MIREATSGDATAVARIFEPYVVETNVTFDITAPSAAEWTDRIGAAHRDRRPFLVVETGDGVVGFAYVGPWRSKEAYAATVENTIYLARAAAGRGHGRALLDELIARSVAAGFEQMIAVIADVGNDVSRRLHLSAGFVEVGTLRGVGVKRGATIDTLLMQLDLTERKGARQPQK